MAAGDPIVGLSELINLATGGGGGAPEAVPWFKDSLIAGAAPGTLVSGRISSLWRYQGSPSAASTVPTTYAALTNASDGALKQAASATGARKRLLSMVACATQPGTLTLYDRLGHSAGNDATVTTPQSTNIVTSALTRYTSGVGVEAFLEIWSQIGSTGTTATISYTNTTPVSGRTSQATTFGGTGFREQDRMIPVPLAVGDKGVTAVASATVLATTGTAGSFGITLAKRIITVPLPLAGVGYTASPIYRSGGPIDLGVASDACLALWWRPNGTTAPAIEGFCAFLEK